MDETCINSAAALSNRHVSILHLSWQQSTFHSRLGTRENDKPPVVSYWSPEKKLTIIDWILFCALSQ